MGLRQQLEGVVRTRVPGIQPAQLLRRHFRLLPFFVAQQPLRLARERIKIGGLRRCRFRFLRGDPGPGLGFLEIQPRRQLLRAVTGEHGELGLQFCHRRRVLRDGHVNLRSLPEVLQNASNGTDAKTVHEKFHGQRRFVIGKLQMMIRFRGKESRAQFAQRREVLAQNHLPIQRVHLLSPCRVFLLFLENRNAFAQPPWHLVARERQGDHMTEFVPEDGVPIGRMAALRRRAICRDHFSEADPEVTRVPRHPERAHPEILRVRKNLDGHRRLQLETIFLPESRVGSIQERQHGLAVNGRLVGGHPHDEMAVRQRREFR